MYQSDCYQPQSNLVGAVFNKQFSIGTNELAAKIKSISVPIGGIFALSGQIGNRSYLQKAMAQAGMGLAQDLVNRATNPHLNKTDPKNTSIESDPRQWLYGSGHSYNLTRSSAHKEPEFFNTMQIGRQKQAHGNSSWQGINQNPNDKIAPKDCYHKPYGLPYAADGYNKKSISGGKPGSKVKEILYAASGKMFGSFSHYFMETGSEENDYSAKQKEGLAPENEKPKYLSRIFSYLREGGKNRNEISNNASIYEIPVSQYSKIREGHADNYISSISSIIESRSKKPHGFGGLELEILRAA